MKRGYRQGYKQGQKDMLKTILGIIVLWGTLTLILAKMFMLF